MLPAAITLVAATHAEPDKLRPLAVMLILSIGYGCAIGSLGTPSGGARNAIILDFWARLYGTRVSYLEWLQAAAPMVLLQIPVVAFILARTFRPEIRDLSIPISRLVLKVREEGQMGRRDWLTIAIFLLTLALWIGGSRTLGLGIPAFIGVCLYLMSGLIRWEDINHGVNWGVVLLYASAISLGLAMQETGAAQWAAGKLLTVLSTVHITGGLPILGAAALLTAVVANVMSHGPAVAILAPIFLQVADLSGGGLIAMGFVIAFSASFTYLTVVGSPANMIIYGSGYLTPGDFLRAGWKMGLSSVVIVLLIAEFYWPLIG